MIYCAPSVSSPVSRDGPQPATTTTSSPSPALWSRARIGCLGSWLAARTPELALVVLGILLRLSLAWWYDVSLGFDYPAHLQYVRYLVDHGRLPPYDLNFSTCNPPLYYALAALMERAGLSNQAVGGISIASSCLQLLFCWLGAELYLRESRLARLLTLAIACVVPVSVHIAGMLSNEPLNGMLCTGATVLLPQVLSRRGRGAVVFGAAAGVFLGLALLTKISGAMVLTAFLIAVAAALVRGGSRGAARDGLRGTVAVLAIAAALSGWHYVRHRVLYGKFVLTAYDPFLKIDPTFKVPYLDRRTLGFVTYWDDEIYAMPYWPVASLPHARFWPVLVTTTFSDYFNFAFVPRPAPGAPVLSINSKPLRPSALLLSRASVLGGTGLALLAVAAWLILARTLWRRGDHSRLVLLLVALLATLGQLHFAVRFPNDRSGPIKGSYLQFAGTVFCGLAGLAIATLWNRRRIVPRLLAVAGMAAVALVAAYTVFARIVVPLGG
jgi:hypothetical protein